MPAENKKQRARRANRAVMTPDQATKEHDFLRTVPTHKSRINRILDFINGQCGGTIPKHDALQHPPAETALLYRMYQIAVRDNMEAPTFRCICKKEFQTPVMATCPDCGETVEYEAPHLAMETNCIKANTKLLDKLFPNLQHTENTINWEGAIISISGEIARIIVQHVPADKRKACLDEIEQLMQRVQGSIDAGSSGQ